MACAACAAARARASASRRACVGVCVCKLWLAQLVWLRGLAPLLRFGPVWVWVVFVYERGGEVSILLSHAYSKDALLHS